MSRSAFRIFGRRAIPSQNASKQLYICLALTKLLPFDLFLIAGLGSPKKLAAIGFRIVSHRAFTHNLLKGR
jgi:membrane-bound metal-dependent hydrolase YbcI (DUF457 family)